MKSGLEMALLTRSVQGYWVSRVRRGG